MKYHTYFKSRKKHDYMVNTNRSKLLNSFYLENQAWGALPKYWKGCTIAKNRLNMTKWNSSHVEFRNGNET
jgi:hypothetical protein